MMELIIFLFLLTCQFLSETFSKNIPRLSAPLFRGREVEEAATGVKVQLNCSELAGEDLKNMQFGNMEKLKHNILTKGVLYTYSDPVPVTSFLYCGPKTSSKNKNTKTLG